MTGDIFFGTPCIYLSGMSYDGCCLKWCEDLLKLKQIVSDIWNLEGKWSLPGGQSKIFCSSNSDVVLEWY